MKKYKDFLGNEITDPWCLNILQRLDQLKKRNKGRKHFSEEDKKEFDAIVKEQHSHWESLRKEIHKIPISELTKRIKNNLDSSNLRLFDTIYLIRPGLFNTSTRRRIRSTRKGMC